MSQQPQFFEHQQLRTTQLNYLLHLPRRYASGGQPWPLILFEALKGCGGNIRFTVYPDAEHDSWTETYDNPDLYEWLLQQQIA